MSTEGNKRKGGAGETFPTFGERKREALIGVSQSLREVRGWDDGDALEGSVWVVGGALSEWYHLHQFQDGNKVSG